ncbi:MAG: hypothetical protein NC489_27415 [Ruminococcus flavefaciens]|nr:hypothetical protein [Ruminococcus flavefaciens]
MYESCTSVCINAAKDEHIKGKAEVERKERIDDIWQVSARNGRHFWARGYYLLEEVAKNQRLLRHRL